MVGYGSGGDDVRGEMTFTADTVTYTPDRNWSGTDEVTFLVKDGHGGYATGTITITVNPVEDAPVTRWDQVVAFEGGSPVTIDVLANDSDAEGPLTVIGIGTTDAVDGGTAVANPDGSITYTPYYDPVGGSGFTGEDFFNYDVIDSAGNIASEVVKVYVSPADPGYDDFPLAWDVYAQTYEDMPVTIDILGSGRTWDDGTVTISAITNLPPEVVVNGGSITYTPPLNYHDQGWPFVEVEDDHLDEFGLPDPQPANHYVEVEIIPVNDAPQVAVDTAWTGIGQTITVSVLNGATDVERDAGEPNQELIVTDAYGPAQGSVCFSRSGVTYTPFETFTSGTDTFTYEVNDGHGGVVTKEVTVHMVNVTDWTLERKLDDGTWVSVPDGEVSWSHDELRWSAYHDGPTANRTGTDWLEKPWADHTNPNIPPETGWASFAQAQNTDPAYGSPGVGIWAITPAVLFGNFDNQTEFAAAMTKEAIDAKGEKIGAKITSIEWERPEIVPGVPGLSSGYFEEDPAGGIKFFPDALLPNTGFRPRIDIVASITPQIEGIDLWFKAYDVDDPSDHDGPIDIDPPGDVNGADNLGGAATLVQGPATGTDSEGKFRGELHLDNAKPGDNYRVAVVGRLTELFQLESLSNDGAGRLFYDKNQDGVNDGAITGEGIVDETTVDIRGIRVTSRLTVWRNLHIEVDSMGNVVGNEIRRIAENVRDNGNGTATVTLDHNLTADVGGEKRFTDPGSTLLDARAYAYPIVSIPQQNVIIVSLPDGIGLPLEFSDVVVQDDDHWQDGEDVPTPDTSEVEAAFAEAFIRPVFDGGGNSDNNDGDVPFDLNVTSAAEAVGVMRWDSKANNSEAYWVSYILGAFQDGYSSDWDSDANIWEAAIFGVTHSTYGGCLIFLETIRDFYQGQAGLKEQDTVVHELGHVVADLDTHEPGPTRWPGTPSRFTQNYLHKMRTIAKPLGS